jgi:hypothetical protein
VHPRLRGQLPRRRSFLLVRVCDRRFN